MTETDAGEPVLAARGAGGRRAVLVTIDQALSSASNLLAMLWVAHVVSAIDFGSFSLLMLVYTFVMGPINALVSMRIVVHPEDADGRPRWVLGSALVLGGLGGLGCVLVGGAQILGGIDLGPALLVLGLALPFLVVQDVGRWVAVARGRPIRAIALDTTWLVLMLAAFAALVVLDAASLLTVTLAWAGTGTLSALLLLVQYGVLRPREVSLTWLRERWDASWRLLVGNLTGGGSVLLGASLIAWVSSPLAVAAVRAAIFLGRPTTAIQNAIGTSYAADVARQKPDNRQLLRSQQKIIVLAALVAVANLVVLVYLPDAIGSRLLGNVWPVIDPLMLPASLWLVVAAAQAGAPPALVGRHQFQSVMVVQIITGLISAAGLVVGAWLDGAPGAVWGLVIGQAVTAVAWWTALLWHLTSSRRGTGEAPTHRA